MYFGKRIFDILVASLGLLLLSPFLLIISVLVLINHGFPVLFKQVRPGLSGDLFTMMKFRTMTNERDADGELLPDRDRLTRFGQLLRSTSLDELPELWSVLVGHMSIVGPRPLLVRYLDRYTPEQNRRHNTRPGITGWAQVNGRNALSWEEKFELDCWYVDNASLWLDIKIIVMTIWKVLRREGITGAGEATMSEYMGTERRE